MSRRTDRLAQEIDELYLALRARDYTVQVTLNLIEAWLKGGRS